MPVPDDVTTADTKMESKHIRAEDFKLDQKLKLQIEDVNMELMPGRDGKPARNRFVLTFVGKEKGLVLNTTNQDFIEARLGKKPNAWIGASIILHRTTASLGGKIVPAFRVLDCRRSAAPTPAPQPAPAGGDFQANDDSEVPF